MRRHSSILSDCRHFHTERNFIEMLIDCSMIINCYCIWRNLGAVSLNTLKEKKTFKGVLAVRCGVGSAVKWFFIFSNTLPLTLLSLVRNQYC